jgi:hypothetical protein
MKTVCVFVMLTLAGCVGQVAAAPEPVDSGDAGPCYAADPLTGVCFPRCHVDSDCESGCCFAIPDAPPATLYCLPSMACKPR